MRRQAAPAVVAALAALVLSGISAASTTLPTLRTAVASRRHVVVTFTLRELAPGHIRVAARRTTTPDGKLLTGNVRLDESLRATRTSTGAWHARTRHTLKPGVYYVQVSGVAVVDCLPAKPCPEHWSNVRRLRIPRS